MSRADPIPRLNAALSGRYHVERELGEGGMATVYMARDLKHGRNVALKVLRPELAAVVGAERFLAEIRTTASLQHPHILPLHDSGDADGLLFYVMPAVEGENLKDRLDREHQLPVDEAVRIATNVAEALDYAHRHGVIHRDIKPANILLLDGKPVISDFGIALAVTSGGAGRLTETGLSLGTPHYMSPEQATGDGNVGPATDIWALGCVLYEMLVGEPPYVASTPQAVLGKIITAEPPSANEARRSVPANVDAAIRKVLEKVPADRFGSAGEMARALGEVGFRHGAAAALVGTGRARGLWNLLSVSLAVGLVSVTVWSLMRPVPTVRFERFLLPAEMAAAAGAANASFSEDGSVLAYRGVSEGTTGNVMVRRWDELAARPIEGTAEGRGQSISPDGSRVAFGYLNEIHIADLDGGVRVTLGEGIAPHWGRDGYIYAYSPERSGMVRWPEGGGDVEQVSRLAPGDIDQRINSVLPSGRVALLVVNRGSAGMETHALDLASGERRLLVAGASGRYARSGHLLYLSRDATLVAAPFDVRRVTVTGPALPMVERVASFAISDDGRLFYATGAAAGTMRQLVWITRAGDVTPIDAAWSYDRGVEPSYSWSVSPDGTRLALQEWTSEGYDIYVKQLPAGPRSRITFDEGADRGPTWSPDGRTVTFSSDRRSNSDAWSTSGDGTGSATLVFGFDRQIAEASLSPDGTWLVIRSALSPTALGRRDIYAVRPGVDSAAVPLMAAPDYQEIQPAVSPNGRFIAYASDETGRLEVYVRPFPNVELGKWPVSVQGGESPRWSRDGRELFYLEPSRRMVAVDVLAEGADFQHGPSEALFTLPSDIEVSGVWPKYDVAPDGRFVFSRFVTGDGPSEPASAVLVLNFFEELRQRVPD
jgi:serine/threonine-protein kinase